MAPGPMREGDVGKGAVVQYPVASTCARGLGQRTRKTGHKNQTWHPELRIETRDPDRIWIVCFIHDTDFDQSEPRTQDRRYSPADPPATHKSTLHNKSRSPAAPTEREQATGYLGFIILRFTDAMLMTMNEVVLHNVSHSAAAPTERE